jgi:hypothetical protein
MAEHVIILGAGASFTSGYPLAVDLRRILSSTDIFQSYVAQQLPNASTSAALPALSAWFAERSTSIKLFREGCFGTIDEFSFLARKRYAEEVRQMKQVVGIIIGLHNPELSFRVSGRDNTTGFEHSDYYPFIQKLFAESDDVRNDIAVLSYNYDPYLEFLLLRAFQQRKKAAGKNEKPPAGLTSGFLDWDADKLHKEKGFCLLKLHGTAVLPPQPGTATQFSEFLTFNEVFSNRDGWLQQPQTGQRLFDSAPSPAMFFPWELVSDNQKFVSKNDFSNIEGLIGFNEEFQERATRFYELAKAIWERAKREIAGAKKISFVGLSMHKFLENGLRFLFADRAKTIENEVDSSIEIVLACPGSLYSGSEFKKLAAPNSLADRLATTLTRVYPKAKKSESSGCLRTHNSGKAGAGGIVCYEDFESFIRYEL